MSNTMKVFGNFNVRLLHRHEHHGLNCCTGVEIVLFDLPLFRYLFG